MPRITPSKLDTDALNQSKQAKLKVKTLTVTTDAWGNAYIPGLPSGAVPVLAVMTVGVYSFNGPLIPYRWGDGGWYIRFADLSYSDHANISGEVNVYYFE